VITRPRACYLLLAASSPSRSTLKTPSSCQGRRKMRANECRSSNPSATPDQPKQEMTMSYDSFKVLPFDVVGTLIDFETGVLDAVRKISGRKAAELSDDQIFASYKLG